MGKYAIKIIVALNCCIVLGLWTTGFLSGLDPNKWGWFSLIGYTFPFFIVTTILFMVVWVFIRRKYLLISFIGLIVAYYPITLYCPINFFDDKDTENTLKIMSYNVYNWGSDYDTDKIDLTQEERQHVMADYFISVNADIVAVQEGYLKGKIDTLKNIYHYIDTVNSVGKSECAVMLLSKYPITHKKNFNIGDNGNGIGAFWINVKGKEIIVIAAHLQSMGLSIYEREKFSTMVHGKNDNTDSVQSTSKTIFGKILSASKKRVIQTDMIARFIENHHTSNIIVMGDFNDIPQSYTHARICDYLKDCYHEKGFGPGYSYKHFGMRVRIDNILCSENFTPLSCKVDNNIDISDHLPIIATVKFK